jgi:DNA primase
VLAQADKAGVVALPDGGLEARFVLDQLLQGSSESPAFSHEELDDAGVIRTGQDFRWPEHVVLVPWVDERGAITAVQQRYVGEDDPPNKYVWPPGRGAQQPFGIEDLRAGSGVDVVVVEGALDVLARRELARMHGEDIEVIGIASAGSPLTGLPVDKLRGRRVRVAVDRDDAGERAAAALHRALQGHVRDLVRVVPTVPEAKDWGEQLQVELSTRGRT